jgi:hypothetical protein
MSGVNRWVNAGCVGAGGADAIDYGGGAGIASAGAGDEDEGADAGATVGVAMGNVGAGGEGRRLYSGCAHSGGDSRRRCVARHQ